jgi:hypothetical protein
MSRQIEQSLSFFVAAALTTFLSFAPSVAAQAPANAGTPNWSAYDSGQYDTINIQNLSVSLNIPVMSKSGAFPFNFNLTGGDSYVYAQTGNMYPGVVAVPLVGTANGILGYTGTFAAPATIGGVPTCPPPATGSGPATAYSNWYIQFADGTTHYLPTSDISYNGASCSGGFTDQTIDGSGYTLSVTKDTVNSIYASNGMLITASAIKDSNNNAISWTGGYLWTDTLGVTALTGGSGYSWSDVAGGSPSVSVSNYYYNLVSSFGCSGITDYNTEPISLPTSINFLPDSTTIGLAWEPNGSGNSTGRLETLTLRTGSTVSFNYNPSSGSHDGLNCTYQVPNKLTRTTSDGTVTYSTSFSASAPYIETVTKLDIEQNKTVYTFTGFSATGYTAPPTTQALTEIQAYTNTGTIASPTYSLTSQTIYCYNSTAMSSSGCSTATVNLPVSEVSAFTTSNGMSTASWTQTKYDNYGNVTYSAKYDFGGTTPMVATTNTYSPTGSCGPGSTVNNKLCKSITTVNNGTSSPTVAYSKFTYSSSGNLLTSSVSPNGGTSFLSNPTANVYNTNGTPSITYDFAGNSTSYSYSSGSYTNCSTCSNLPFPTSMTTGGLTTYATYDGAGGVKITHTDASGNNTIYGYTEPWNRVTSIQDSLGNTVNQTYSVTSLKSSFAFGSSVNNTTTTLDGYGRPINKQTQQGPSSSNYDTVSTAYSFLGSANPSEHYQSTNVPCTTTLGATCGWTQQVFEDMLNRVRWASTPATTEYVQTLYNLNDVLSILGPASPNENLKQVQKEYDGLGRLTSVCKISTTVMGSTACLQANGSYYGVLTTTKYSSATGSQTVTSTRGSQIRSKTVDGLGRVTSITTPEGGTITNVYDSVTCGGAFNFPGKLVKSTFANGNFACYAYDTLGRLSDIGAGYSGGGTTLCRRFRYDSATNGYTTQPSGSTITNVSGRMVEAETDNCVQPPTSPITDEWFSYDADGHMTDMWELTPHSGQYYHSAATFNGNGTVATLHLKSPSSYTLSYGLDGEGRWNSLSEGTDTVVPTSGVTFNAAGQPTLINIGPNSDNDAYTYSPYTGNMTQWVYTVGTGSSNTETGVPTWNPNGTLNNLAINDGFNSGGTQTCYFNPSSGSGMGYDDLGRLLYDSCGSGGSLWNQQYTYDQYDNLTKTSTGYVFWNPTYSPTTNHYACAAANTTVPMKISVQFRPNQSIFFPLFWIAYRSCQDTSSKDAC